MPMNSDHFYFLNTSSPATKVIKDFDWESTPLGSVESWDPNLKCHLQMVVNSSQATFMTWGQDSTVLPNDAMVPMLGGRSLQDVVGACHKDVWPSIWKELEPLVKEVHQGKSYFFENYHFAEDHGGVKRDAYYTFSYTPLYDSNNVNSGLLCTIVDTTHLFEVQEELKIAKDVAERASAFKTNFVANMSHEIRTPLGVIMGFADLIEQPHLRPAERANYIDIMRRNGEQLGAIINDVLDLTKVETGHMDVEMQEIITDEILEEVVSIMSVTAKQKSLSLTVSKQQDYPNKLVGDPTKVTQILMNLISNAVKFTKAGSIDIVLDAWRDEGKIKGCKFQVVDTGVGIAPDKEDRLFKRFSQGDESITRKFGGTGIGLSLSKSLAKLMGGDVVLEKTEVGKGSTFTFVLGGDENELKPQHENQEFQGKDSKKKFEKDALSGKHLLVVEDSPDNQRLIWHYLSSFGASVEFANNGAEGLEKAPKGDFDLVLMDLQMPVMDGYTSVRKLRSNNYEKPIVALTAHALSDVKTKCLHAGFSAHLTKPIKINTMLDTILRLTD